MMTVIRATWGPAVLAFVGAVLSMMFAPLIFMAWLNMFETIDELRPPVKMTLASAEKIDSETLRIKYYVTRYDDCFFVKMTGFSGTVMSGMNPLAIHRSDNEPPIDYPVGMTILSNAWDLHPIKGPRITTYGYYDCGGRLVKTKLIDEAIG